MLPKIEQPHYNTVLPISKMKVNYRPYLMKEQKIILIAMSGEDSDDIMGSMIQIISNCTEGTVDAHDLNSVDIAFLMTKIRAASEGGTVDIYMKCNKVGEDGEVCGHRTEMEVDLDRMEVTGEYDEDKATIDLGGGIGIKLKIPGIEMFELLSQSQEEIMSSLPILIDYIYDADGGLYKLENESQEEIDRFIDDLSAQNVRDIGEFFATLPKLKVDINFACEACGHEEVISVEDIQSFLD